MSVRARIAPFALFLAWMTHAIAVSASATVSTACFDLAFFNFARSAGNVQCYLQLKPNVEKALLRPEPRTDDLVAQFELWIEARAPRTGQVIGEWRFRDAVRQAAGSQENALLRSYPLRLPPDNYEMHVQVRDRVNGRVYFEALPFECRSTASPALSDLQFDLVKSFGPVSLTQPLYGLHIENQPDTLRFNVELIADQPAMLSVRTVLYFQQAGDQSRSGDASRYQVRTYTTQQQHSEVFRLQTGTNAYAGSLPLGDAPDGEYLLELSFFQDGELRCSNSRSFILDWPRLRDIFADLDEAIARMAWIASPQTLQRLSQIPDADQKLREFLAWWERWASEGKTGGSAAMKRYFSRVFEAEEALAEGWKSDRGRTLVLYGQPDYQEAITLPGRDLLVWVHHDLNLVHLFHKTEDRYDRIEI
jgi:GWxTD domain-containing protein